MNQNYFWMCSNCSLSHYLNDQSLSHKMLDMKQNLHWFCTIYQMIGIVVQIVQHSKFGYFRTSLVIYLCFLKLFVLSFSNILSLSVAIYFIAFIEIFSILKEYFCDHLCILLLFSSFVHALFDRYFIYFLMFFDVIQNPQRYLF